MVLLAGKISKGFVKGACQHQLVLVCISNGKDITLLEIPKYTWQMQASSFLLHLKFLIFREDSLFLLKMISWDLLSRPVIYRYNRVKTPRESGLFCLTPHFSDVILCICWGLDYGKCCTLCTRTLHFKIYHSIDMATRMSTLRYWKLWLHLFFILFQIQDIICLHLFPHHGSSFLWWHFLWLLMNYVGDQVQFYMYVPTFHK